MWLLQPILSYTYMCYLKKISIFDQQYMVFEKGFQIIGSKIKRKLFYLQDWFRDFRSFYAST